MRNVDFRKLVGFLILCFCGMACGGQKEDQGDLVPVCSTSRDCEENYVCEEGTCVVAASQEEGDLGQPCRSDQSCDSPYVCEEGTCVVAASQEEGDLGQPCRSDQSCDNPYVCEEGTCVATVSSWNLPTTINVLQGGRVGVRQWLIDGDGLTITVTDLPAGVIYDEANETLYGSETGTSSGTTTFTAGEAVSTATVALVAVGDNAARLMAILQNYTVPTILADLQYPADPVTSTTHEVRNDAELAAAIGGDGRRIRVYGPGNGGQLTYDQFDLGARSDIDIVMDNDATISGSSGWAWWGAVRRFRWTGGNINIAGNADGWRINDVEDVLFDDVRIYKSSGTSGHVLYPGNANQRRFAMINSTVEILPNVAPLYYAVFISTNSATSSDWIFLNNRFIGNGPPVRKMNLGVRSVHVGNYYTSLTEQNQNASIRFHHSIDKMWFAHNVSVFGAGTQPNFNPAVGDPGHIMNDIRIEENRFFATQSDINSGSVYRAGDMVPALQEFATNWVFLNNIWSDPTGPAGGETFGGVFISVPYVREGDLRVGPGHPSYETAPSPTEFGAIR